MQEKLLRYDIMLDICHQILFVLFVHKTEQLTYLHEKSILDLYSAKYLNLLFIL